jgi:uncharacterized membrane protein
MTAHHWIIHFPVALLLAGAAADAIGAAASAPQLRRWATPLLVAGAAAAVLAFATGQGALLLAQGRNPADDAVDLHARWGGAGAWPLAAAGALRLAWRDRLRGAYGAALLAAAVLSALLVVLVSRSGMAIMHG